MSKLIDGRKISSELMDVLSSEVSLLRKKFGIIPSLRVVLIGNNPASELYVHNKLKAAEKIGVQAEIIRPDDSISEDGLLSLLNFLNNDDSIHGIITQLPLPDTINPNAVLEKVIPFKDVDGFSSANLGKLFAGIKGYHVSCTARACLHLIKSVIPSLKGLDVAIIGSSNTVGKPLAHLLLAEKCTVTLLHEFSADVAGHCRSADIVVSASGCSLLLKNDFIKEGATVIDVGISKVNGKFVGDVDFDAVVNKVAYITPVPGGVGPITVSYLLQNTIIASCLLHNIDFSDIGIQM